VSYAIDDELTGLPAYLWRDGIVGFRLGLWRLNRVEPGLKERLDSRPGRWSP